MRDSKPESEGRMQPGGRAQIEAARADGPYERTYDSPAGAEIQPIDPIGPG